MEFTSEATGEALSGNDPTHYSLTGSEIYLVNPAAANHPDINDLLNNYMSVNSFTDGEFSIMHNYDTGEVSLVKVVFNSEGPLTGLYTIDNDAPFSQVIDSDLVNVIETYSMKYVFNTNMIDGGDVGDVGTDPYVSVINPPVSNIPIYAYKGDNGQMVPVKIFDGTEYISGGGQPDAGSWSDYREVIQQSLIEQAIADGIPSENLYSHVSSQMPYGAPSFNYTFGEYGFDVLGANDGYGNYLYTNINPYSLPHYPEDPADTVYTLDGSTIEGVASGNYHIYESHSSGRDNDFRVTGEDATLLSDAQVVELDAINPIGYSTQSETVPGGMVKLDAPIAEVLEIIPPEAFQVVDNGDETVTLTPFDDTDDDGIFDGAYADANNADAGNPVTLSKSAYDAAIGSSGNPAGVLPELNDWTDSGETLDGSVVYNLTGTDTYAVKAESGNAMVEITFTPETLTDATATETGSVSTTTASSEVHPVYVVGDKYFAFDGTELAEVTKDSDGQYTLLEGSDGETSDETRSDALRNTDPQASISPTEADGIRVEGGVVQLSSVDGDGVVTWTDAGDGDIDAAEGTVSFMDTTSENLPIFSVGSDHYAFKGGELVPVTRDDDGGYSDPQTGVTDDVKCELSTVQLRLLMLVSNQQKWKILVLFQVFTSMKLFQLTTV